MFLGFLHKYSYWVVRIHEALVFLPHLPIPEEAITALRETFQDQYDRVKPSALLGSVFTASEFDFYKLLNIKDLSAQVFEESEIALDPERTVVLQLPMCDFQSPMAWAVLAHEMGHAIDEANKISESVVDTFVPGPDNTITRNLLLAWCREVAADLIGARALGPSAILAVLSIEYCFYPGTHIHEYARDFVKGRYHHPPTKWRLAIVSSYLERMLGHDFLKLERDFYKIAWDYSVARATAHHPDPQERQAAIEELAAQDAKEFRTCHLLAEALEGPLDQLSIQLPGFDPASLQRCSRRLEQNLPVSAQGAPRRELSEAVRQYRAHFAEAQPDLRKVAFEQLCGAFAETPLPVPVILLSGQIRRLELIGNVDLLPDMLASKTQSEKLEAEIRALDETISSSIRTAAVHRLLLTKETHIDRLPGDSGRPQPPEGSLLVDIEILRRLVAEAPDLVFVSPLIDPRTQVGPSSLDLRVGTELFVTRVVASTHVDLTAEPDAVKEQLRRYFEPRRVAAGEGIVLHPGEFALASTLEYIVLPRDIAGRLEGRSSLGRLGLQIHATAGFVDPGFEGTLTFELSNAGKLPVRFPPGYRLGQICLFRVTPAEVDYMMKQGSKYGRRRGVEISQIHRDIEIARKNQIA